MTEPLTPEQLRSYKKTLMLVSPKHEWFVNRVFGEVERLKEEMRRITTEYEEYMTHFRKKADEDLASAYRTYPISQLWSDWRYNNISTESRNILKRELLSRGVGEERLAQEPKR